ncbi:hypothetical protein K443DRAFT_164965 [Laccaria amethystina LaAM-08-1]|uniref:Uncharacterized protein n=1 Tax=Laccaria amethystina LaAM-08-1 TaxID=1095629 RepID=A0A0C9XDH1_9AGAR|nr:hypothetical protein K443DRAFT_164965 [Laccaria amethystina LaAM-08-1]
MIICVHVFAKSITLTTTTTMASRQGGKLKPLKVRQMINTRTGRLTLLWTRRPRRERRRRRRKILPSRRKRRLRPRRSRLLARKVGRWLEVVSRSLAINKMQR